MSCEWTKCWSKCIPPPGASNSSNRNSNRISFILFSAINLRLLSKFFDCFETYNANGSPASFGLSKTSMHFAISFCFCSVGFTRLGLALFYWNLNSTSPFAPHLPALALSFDDWLWVFYQGFTCSTKRIFPWMARSSHKRGQYFGHSLFYFSSPILSHVVILESLTYIWLYLFLCLTPP